MRTTTLIFHIKQYIEVERTDDHGQIFSISMHRSYTPQTRSFDSIFAKAQITSNEQLAQIHVAHYLRSFPTTRLTSQVQDQAYQ